MSSTIGTFQEKKNTELSEVHRHEINTAILALDAAYRIFVGKYDGRVESAQEMYELGLEKLRRLMGE